MLLVIDAAYAEYVDADDYDAGLDLVEAFANVVVTRTFSKIYGLGGVRLGWAYCPAAVADVLNRVRNPFNVSTPAQAAGLAALGDQDFVAAAKAHNTRWREWTAERLRALGLTVPESHGNFVLVRFADEPGRDALAADGFLKSRGIIARRIAAYGLPDALRISIGAGGRDAGLRFRAGRFHEPVTGMSEPLFFERIALIGIGLIGSSLARVVRAETVSPATSPCARAPMRRSTRRWRWASPIP